MYEIGQFQTFDQKQGWIAKNGYEAIVNLFSERNWVITMFVLALTFSAGVQIILYGTKTFLAPLIFMFEGISQKLIKNAKAAVDVPIVFTYAPNAIIIGFFSSLLGGMLALGLSSVLVKTNLISALILPSLIIHFFYGRRGLGLLVMLKVELLVQLLDH